MFEIPVWLKQLDSSEKLIAFLKFVGREDLVMKFETQGFLYASEILEAPRQNTADWSYDSEPDDYIDFIDFGKEGP